jgi:dTDP-4-amino-4,6-dideoxygalactose transaminase
MKNFGFSGYDQVIYIGTNGKMNEISAAMGLTSLESLDEFIEVNYQNYLLYRQELHDLPGVKIIQYDPMEKNNYQYIILEVDNQVTGINREQLVTILHAENVLARRYFYPGCHQMEPYRSFYPNAGLVLPETEKLVWKVMSLPNGNAVGVRDVKKICEIVRFVILNSDKIQAKMLEKGNTS